METSVFVAGSGGHGIQSLGKTFVQGALLNGREATCYPRYGIEKRGGYSSCYLVISDDKIGNVKKAKSDIVIVIDQRAFNMFADTVKPDGYLIVNSSTISAEKTPCACTRLDYPIMDIALELGSLKAISTVLTGLLAGVEGIFEDPELIRDSISKKWEKKPEIQKMNLAAFDAGISLGKQIKLTR